MTNLYYISILRIRNCFKMFSCFIEAIYIHTCWVGEAVEDGVMPTGGVIVPAQPGEVAPAVADMGTVTHSLGAEQLHGQP